MKISTILFVVSLSSCTESFIQIDPAKFNARIRERADISTPENLILLFYNYPMTEGDPKITIDVESIKDQIYIISLIHEGFEDDSQSGEKIVMKAERINNTWKVIEIKKNWKCWEGRGHTNWGTDPCN